ncbi:MAG: type II toxin-antitoxin system RelE/ParE family toxin [Chloroflexi bacterium]|nr:type II toxin-antitoxin system RelE/ParE family toxin [Chloroflexota bacterium]MBI4505095.1 type II toxin-antitoxin system RelE/ParE family toxin [Chloroflexota bacterium]
MYSVALRARAQKDIAALPPSLARRVLAAIAGLSEDPRPPGARKLQAEESYRIRVGDRRIVFEIEDHAQRVVIVRVKHRRDVYRSL